MFALIWIALRWHPLYTWDSTLRIAGGTLLLILACAGLMVLAVWLSAARSSQLDLTIRAASPAFDNLMAS